MARLLRRPLHAARTLVCGDLVLVLQREANVVQAVQEFVLGELVDIEFGGDILGFVPDALILEIDAQAVPRVAKTCS